MVGSCNFFGNHRVDEGMALRTKSHERVRTIPQYPGRIKVGNPSVQHLEDGVVRV
jgi:hypothetical protein